MDLKKKIRTTLLTDDETLRHRLDVSRSGAKWACDCCGFEESGVMAWAPVKGGDIRLSCLECHPYEDPLRYREDVAVAWLPLHSAAAVSHLVRLLALSGKTDIAGWVVAEASKSQQSAALKKLFEAVRDAEADTPADGGATTSIGELFSKPSVEPANPLSVPLGKSIGKALSAVAGDIARGIEAAEVAFEGMKFEDVVTAMEVGLRADRDLMASGVRFIPRRFSSARIERWDEATKSLKDMFLSELIEVSKLERNLKAVASDPAKSTPAGGDDAAAEETAPDAEAGEAPAPESRPIRSLLSFFRLTGGKS